MRDLQFLALGLTVIVVVCFLDAHHPLILRVVAIGLGVATVVGATGVRLKHRTPPR